MRGVRGTLLLFQRLRAFVRRHKEDASLFPRTRGGKERGESREERGQRRKEKGERTEEKGERREERGERRKERGEPASPRTRAVVPANTAILAAVGSRLRGNDEGGRGNEEGGCARGRVCSLAACGEGWERLGRRRSVIVCARCVSAPLTSPRRRGDIESSPPYIRTHAGGRSDAGTGAGPFALHPPARSGHSSPSGGAARHGRCRAQPEPARTFAPQHDAVLKSALVAVISRRVSVWRLLFPPRPSGKRRRSSSGRSTHPRRELQAACP